MTKKTEEDSVSRKTVVEAYSYESAKLMRILRVSDELLVG